MLGKNFGIKIKNWLLHWNQLFIFLVILRLNDWLYIGEAISLSHQLLNNFEAVNSLFFVKLDFLRDSLMNSLSNIFRMLFCEFLEKRFLNTFELKLLHHKKQWLPFFNNFTMEIAFCKKFIIQEIFSFQLLKCLLNHLWIITVLIHFDSELFFSFWISSKDIHCIFITGFCHNTYLGKLKLILSLEERKAKANYLLRVKVIASWLLEKTAVILQVSAFFEIEARRASPWRKSENSEMIALRDWLSVV